MDEIMKDVERLLNNEEYRKTAYGIGKVMHTTVTTKLKAMFGDELPDESSFVFGLMFGMALVEARANQAQADDETIH